MGQLDEGLVDPFAKIVRFCEDNQELAWRARGKKAPAFGTREYLELLAARYIAGRKRITPSTPGTVPDPALSLVMVHGFDVDPKEIDHLTEGHRRAMVAENIVGELLERYIAQELDDWVWCPGEVVKHIDFIRESRLPGVKWDSLQIKNRDNSENSSSSAIRDGTEIQKWYRTVSRTGGTRWEEFPVETEQNSFTEERFRQFIIDYLGKKAD